jgi:hypothetical protein
MRLRALQFFFFLVFIFLGVHLLLADISPGQIYKLNFVDVDGNTLLTADGHVTVVVLTTQSNIDKARAVGDHVPDYCLGNPTYRMITVVNFQKKRAKPTRMILSALMQHRLNAEARRLQTRYNEKNITRDARRDIFAVADFDGAATAQLGARFESADFRVFVFARNGELLRQWNDVPSAEELVAVVK